MNDFDNVRGKPGDYFFNVFRAREDARKELGMSPEQYEAHLNRIAREALAIMYGIPPSADGRPPVFNLNNIRMGQVYTRSEAQPELRG